MNINEPKQGRGFNVPFIGGRGTLQRSDSANRMPMARKLPDNVRNHFVAMSAEFVGTVLFLFFAFAGTQVANNVPSTLNASSFTTAKVPVPNGTVGPPIEAGANPAQLLYIALSFGFSLAVNVWIFFRISGGLFNPAVCWHRASRADLY
jgi:aquaporin rerated protein, other eukaryote